MRIRLALCLVGLCLLSSGCQLITNGTRNLLFEATTAADERQEHRRAQQLAEQAWQSALQANPEVGYTEDFAQGFKDGFSDYLEAGGTGQAPAVPPRQYWRSRYETPAGYRAIEDWYAGFRQGTSAAQASGLRLWMTVPSGLAAPGHEPGPLPAVAGPAPQQSREELLPLPRKVTPGGQNEPPLAKVPAPVGKNQAPPKEPTPLPKPLPLPTGPGSVEREPPLVLPEMPILRDRRATPGAQLPAISDLPSPLPAATPAPAATEQTGSSGTVESQLPVLPDLPASTPAAKPAPAVAERSSSSGMFTPRWELESLAPVQSKAVPRAATRSPRALETLVLPTISAQVPPLVPAAWLGSPAATGPVDENGRDAAGTIQEPEAFVVPTPLWLGSPAATGPVDENGPGAAGTVQEPEALVVPTPLVR